MIQASIAKPSLNTYQSAITEMWTMLSAALNTPKSNSNKERRQSSPGMNEMCLIVLSASQPNQVASKWDGMSTQDVPLPYQGRHAIVMAVKYNTVVRWHFRYNTSSDQVFSVLFWEHGKRGYMPCKKGINGYLERRDNIGFHGQLIPPAPGMVKLQWRNYSSAVRLSYHLETSADVKGKNRSSSFDEFSHLNTILGVGYAADKDTIRTARHSIARMESTEQLDEAAYKIL